MPERRWVGQGQYVQPTGGVDRIPDYDPRSGDHLWMMMAGFKVDPARFADPSHTAILDTENLYTLVGPGCYWCERPYTPLLATRRCPGEPRE